MIYLSQKWKNEQNTLFHANVERPKGSTMTSSTLKNTPLQTAKCIYLRCEATVYVVTVTGLAEAESPSVSRDLKD